MNAEVQAGFFLSLRSILFPRAWPEPPHYNRDEAPWSSLGAPEAVIHSSRDRLGCREHKEPGSLFLVAAKGFTLAQSTVVGTLGQLVTLHPVIQMLSQLSLVSPSLASEMVVPSFRVGLPTST